MTTKTTRRDFLKWTGTIGTGLVLGFRLDPASADEAGVQNMARPNGRFEPNAYIAIDPDGTITLQIHRSDMGQGTNTSVAMILAEELEADLATLRLEQARADRVYGDQVTGGSASISGSYHILRRAGATARMMLLAAAAQTWGVDIETCYAEQNKVIHEPTGDTLTYGELAELAATLEAPSLSAIQMKDPSDFRLIGTRQGNWHNPGFVTGRAQYASDLQLPGMLVAVIARPPVVGADIYDFDDSAALAVPGVRHVVALEQSDGIAVVADNTWAALKGREALDVEWEGGQQNLNTADLRQGLRDRFNPEEEPGTLKVAFDIAYMAHAPMEPMVCVADVRADGCDVWAPTQNRQDAKSVAQRLTRLGSGDVRIHVPLIGGAFGRRLQNDYVAEAVEISMAVGAPVKVFWTREDDMQHDYYHPMVAGYLQASVDLPTRINSQGAEARGLRTGAWRSVGEHPEAFAHECFVDEFAEFASLDVVELQRQINANSPRLPVLELVLEKSGWGDPLPEGWGRGLGVHSTFDATHVAQVVEASVDAQGKIIVHRVVCAVDCGLPVNPDGIEAQMEGGIVFALSAALYGEITVEGGRVQQSNFHDYPILRMDEMPVIEVYIVDSDNRPSGTGEMGVPPLAPALANALYAATGKRVHHLPIRREDLQ